MAMASERSVHSAGIVEVHQVPINVINRPIPSVLEEEKVKSLMKTIEVRVIYERVDETRSQLYSLIRHFFMVNTFTCMKLKGPEK